MCIGLPISIFINMYFVSAGESGPESLFQRMSFHTNTYYTVIFYESALPLQVDKKHKQNAVEYNVCCICTVLWLSFLVVGVCVCYSKIKMDDILLPRSKPTFLKRPPGGWF